MSRREIDQNRLALLAIVAAAARRPLDVDEVAAVNSGNPEKVVVWALRASMCEQLADALPSPSSPFELFLTGIYSQVHVMLGTDLETAVRNAPVPPGVRKALIERDGPLWRSLQLVVAWEIGEWNTVVEFTNAVGVGASFLRRSMCRPSTTPTSR